MKNEQNTNQTQETISFTKIKHDVNGNPRYVCHFLSLLTTEEFNAYNPNLYDWACKRANKIGGRKFHNKQYGGGIVFQSYNLTSLVADIANATSRNFTAYEVN